MARCEPSVALIKGKVSSGTGFLVRHGVIATNAHVIEEEFISNLEVRFPSAPAGNQGPSSAQLLYEDRKRDIAFLAVKSDLPVLRIAPNYSFVKGEDILVIGNPGLGDEVVLENAISRGVMSSKTVIEGMPYHQMNISINPGNSGGPVFDSRRSRDRRGDAQIQQDRGDGLLHPRRGPERGHGQGRYTPAPNWPRAIAPSSRSSCSPSPARSTRSHSKSGRESCGPRQHGGSNANLLPTEEVQKLHEVVTSLDEKLFSLVDGELPGLQNDPSSTQQHSAAINELAANYQAMKKLYANPNRLADQYFSQIQNVKAQHLRLIQSLQKT